MKSYRNPWRGLLAGALISVALGASAQAAPTIEEVMAAPDDLALNLAYARAEADGGDLLSAAGALERILILQPNAHQARLFYAAVLYRLGDYQASRQQLAQLESVELTPLQRAEVARYRKSIERRLSRFEVTGQVAAGLHWEEDALGALSTQFDFFDPIEDEGTSQVYSGRVGFLYKLRPEGEYALYGTASGYHKSDISGPDNEFQRGELRFGVQHVGRMSAWQAGLVGRRYWVFGDEHLSELGAQASVSKRLNTATTVRVGVEAVSQEFDNEPPFLMFFGGGRDGSRIDARLGASHRFSGRSTLSGAVGYEWKEAEREPFSYDAPYLQAGFEQLLGRGAYLDLTGSIRNVKYAEEDPLLFDERREDMRTHARVALGAPLSAFTREGATGDIRENIKVEGAVSHVARDSETPVADYDSWGAELRFIWRFGR